MVIYVTEAISDFGESISHNDPFLFRNQKYHPKAGRPDWMNFLPVGWLLSSEVYFRKNTKVAQFIRLLFSTLQVTHVFILTKNGLGIPFGRFFHKVIWSPFPKLRHKSHNRFSVTGDHKFKPDYATETCF
jgi:hypothetical protein